MKFPPFDLKTEATQEVYQLIDEKYRKLPKTKNSKKTSTVMSVRQASPVMITV